MSAPLPDEPLFAFIREACAEVARRARFVKIESGELERFAAVLAQHRPTPPALDPAHLAFREEHTTIAFAITLNAVNFGSGYFPHLRKRGELSGYRTVATALRERFEREGSFSAAELARIERGDVAGKDHPDAVGPVAVTSTDLQQATQEVRMSPGLAERIACCELDIGSRREQLGDRGVIERHHGERARHHPEGAESCQQPLEGRRRARRDIAKREHDQE